MISIWSFIRWRFFPRLFRAVVIYSKGNFIFNCFYCLRPSINIRFCLVITNFLIWKKNYAYFFQEKKGWGTKKMYICTCTLYMYTCSFEKDHQYPTTGTSKKSMLICIVAFYLVIYNVAQLCMFGRILLLLTLISLMWTGLSL